jgi:hypothetical protein
MKKTGLVTAAFLTLTQSLALACSTAEAADVILSRTASGGLDLKAQITTPNGCYFAGNASLGTPEGVPAIENAIVINLGVSAKGDICPQEITILDYHLTLTSIPKDSVAVIIYETWPQAKTIKATAFPLPGRKK